MNPCAFQRGARARGGAGDLARVTPKVKPDMYKMNENHDKKLAKAMAVCGDADLQHYI